MAININQLISKDKSITMFLLLISKLLAAASGLLIVMVLARSAASSLVGLYGILISSIGILALAGQFGLQTYSISTIPKAFSRNDSDELARILSVILTQLFISCSALYVFLLIFSSQFNEIVFKQLDFSYIKYLYVVIIIRVLGLISVELIRAFGFINFYAIFGIANPALIIISIVSSTEVTVNSLVLSICFSYSATSLVSILYFLNIIRGQGIQINFSLKLASRQIGTTFLLLAISLLQFLNSQSDVLFLGLKSDLDTIGIYTVGIKYTLAAGFPVALINTYYAAKLSEVCGKSGRDRLKIFYAKLRRLMFILTLSVSSLLLLFSVQYANHTNVDFETLFEIVSIILAGITVSSAAGPSGNVLLFTGNGKLFFIHLATSFLISVVCMISLFKVHGLQGVSIGVALSAVYWKFSCFYSVKNLKLM